MPVGIELTFGSRTTPAPSSRASGVPSTTSGAGRTRRPRPSARHGRQVRRLAGELSTELNPALGSVVARASWIGSEGDQYPTALADGWKAV